MSQHKGRINIAPNTQFPENPSVGDIATITENGVTDTYEYSGTKFGWQKMTDQLQYLALEEISIDAAYPDPIVVDQVVKNLP